MIDHCRAVPCDAAENRPPDDISEEADVGEGKQLPQDSKAKR